MGAYLHAFFGLVLVIGLIVATVFALKKLQDIKNGAYGSGAKKRLSVSAALYLDPKRRLVLVKRDDVEHLLLVGGGHDVLIETNIAAGTAGRDQLENSPASSGSG